MSGDSVPWQASYNGSTPPTPDELKFNGEKGTEEQINNVRVLDTHVNGTALKIDGPTRPNRGRVAFSFRIGNSNKSLNDKCGAIFGRHSPSCQTKIPCRTEATQARQNEAKIKEARLSSSL